MKGWIPSRLLLPELHNVHCFLTPPDSEQQFELPVGEGVTVKGISQLIEVSASSL